MKILNKEIDGFLVSFWVFGIFVVYVFIAVMYCTSKEHEVRERLYKECMKTNPEWECYSALKDTRRGRR